MFQKRIFLVLVIFFLLTSFIFVSTKVHADDVTPSPSPSADQAVSSVGDCASQHLSPNDCVTYYQNKLSDAQTQDKTLSSQIAVMDSQVRLTEARIFATKQQIINLEEDIDTTSKKISSLNSSLSDITKVLLSRIVATYQVGSEQPIQMLLSSDSISNFVTRANYLKLVQAHDKKLVFDTVQAKNDYANQQQIFEDKKKQVITLQQQLQDYTTQLGVQKQQKQQLLAQTQGSESTYENLLSQAKAQLAGFSSFAVNQGGATILTNQTVCDDWGCYYNQRDSQWGNIALNHSQYTISSDGCLMTSMAMIYTHYGHRSVTPLTINSNPDNFAAYYPAYLKYSITADGASSSRVGTYIDSNLQSGTPVIVGIRYSSGDTHFVVLTGGSHGNYLMNDPFTPNGHQIAFSSKYSMNSIFEIDKVLF